MTRAVFWSRDALDELKGIARYIAKDNPRSTRIVAAAIREAGAKLGRRSTGRRGRVEGTFEKSLAPRPYIIAYAIEPRKDGSEAIAILHVIHTARDWRPGTWPA